MTIDDSRQLQKAFPWLKLTFFATTMFFLGIAEFMLSSMLPPLAEAFGTTVDNAAFLISGYAFSYAVAAPIIAFFSGGIHREKLLRISILFYAIDNIGIIFSPTLGWAIALRAFGGISSAIIIPVVFSLVSDLVIKNKQADAMGYVLLGMTSGIAFGPAMAGFLNDQIAWWAPFAFCALGSLFIFFTGPLILNMPYKDFYENNNSVERFQIKPIGTLLSLLRIIFAKGLWNGSGVATFIMAGEVLHTRYGLSPTNTGMIVGFFGLGLGVGNITIGRLNPYLKKEEITILLMMCITLVSIFLLAIAQLPLWGDFVALTMLGYSLGSGAPVSTVLILKITNEGNKIFSLALVETMNNVSVFIFLPFAICQLISGYMIYSFLILSVGSLIGILIFIFSLLCSNENTIISDDGSGSN